MIAGVPAKKILKLKKYSLSWPPVAFANPYRLGKASTTPETQTLPAPNHTSFGSRYTVEHAYQHIVASS